jgi:hypothetical protein
MANCSQINNTTIIGTSAVKYDSTPLPCTDVVTCDGLNTILAKFDAVMCNVKADVDILTEDILSLTEDVMVITEDITNIYSQLNVCCPTTTTTTTVVPTTTTTSSSTSSTTSTSTTATPTTTTTTTIVSSCTEVELNVSINCPGQSYALFQYTDCNGDIQTAEVNSGDLPRFCVLSTAPAPTFLCGEGTIEEMGECNITTTTTSTTVIPTTTTTSSSTSSTSTTTTIAPTTTTTTTIYCDCYVYEVTVTQQQLEDSDNGIVYVYVDEACFSNEYYTFLFNKAGTETICVSRTNLSITQYIEIDGKQIVLPDPIKLNECCIAPMFISTESSPTDSPGICEYELTTTLYIKNIGANKYAYLDPEGTAPFDGNNKFWRIQILGDASGYVEIRGDGKLTYPISYCI